MTKNFFIQLESKNGINISFTRKRIGAVMLVFQNKGIAAMMVYQSNPPGIELYFYANTLFCFSSPIWLLVTRLKTLYRFGLRDESELKLGKKCAFFF